MKKIAKSFFTVLASALMVFSVVGCQNISAKNKTPDSPVTPEVPPVVGPEDGDDDPETMDTICPEITDLSVEYLLGNLIVTWNSVAPEGKSLKTPYGIVVAAYNVDEEFEIDDFSQMGLVNAKLDEETGFYYDDGAYLFSNLVENGAYQIVVGVYGKKTVAVLDEAGKPQVDENGNPVTEQKTGILTSLYADEVVIAGFEGVFGKVCVIDFDDANGKYMFPVDQDDEYIVINNAKGKNITYTNLNLTDKIVSANDSRKADEIFALSDEPAAVGVKGYSSLVENKSTITSLQSFNIPGVKAFEEPEYDAPVTVIKSDARYSVAGNENKFDINNLTTDGTTYRYIWLDNDSSISTFKNKKVTLRAIGKDKKSQEPICLVWVADENYTTGRSNAHLINSSVAQKLADNFAARCAEEREVFGHEADVLIKEQPREDLETFVKMEDYSDTKDLINIVVYDIGQDYETQDAGILGYFWSKDYFVNEDKNFYAAAYGYDNHVLDMSNAGKYFYIDAPFCNYTEYDKETGEYIFDGVNKGLDPNPEIISTLVHEYQHMIHFGEKTLDHELHTETWFNEMCSMLCEDIFQDASGIGNDAAPMARIPSFNLNYHYSGVTDWRRDGSVGISYASAYTFGAWLARNFGGVPLIMDMMGNETTGLESVLEAVNSVNNTKYTQKDLFEKYLEAVVFRTDFAVEKGIESTFFKEGESYTTKNGTVLTLKKLNLYSDSLSPHKFNSEFTFGPRRHGAGTAVYVRPNAFVIHNVGTAETDQIIIHLTKNVGNDDVYVMIQDEFDLYEPSTLE